MVRIALMFGFLMVFLGTSIPVLCQSIPVPQPAYRSGVRPCGPQLPAQPAPPVARSVNVTVPVPPPAQVCAPATCAPAPPYCCSPAAPPAPPRQMPVRVDIAVRPEACDQRRPVPVVYRDPGFLGPIICHSVGLVGAAVAAPFRVLEMLCPVPAQPCPRRCGPRPQPSTCGYQQQTSPSFAPKCPMPCTQPVAPCPPMLACAPPGPSVAPLPPCASPSPCGPFMPPAMVERDEEPPCAPQSLLGGLINLPFTLMERGRLVHDLGSAPAGVRPCNR